MACTRPPRAAGARADSRCRFSALVVVPLLRPRTTQINAFELAAILLALLVWSSELSSCRIVLTAPLSISPLRGRLPPPTSPSSPTSSQIAAQFSIEPRLVWVLSRLKRADGPSRGRAPASGSRLPVGESLIASVCSLLNTARSRLAIARGRSSRLATLVPRPQPFRVGLLSYPLSRLLVSPDGRPVVALLSAAARRPHVDGYPRPAGSGLSPEEVFQETSRIELTNRLYNTVAYATFAQRLRLSHPRPRAQPRHPDRTPLAKIGPPRKRIRALVAGDAPLQNDSPPEWRRSREELVREAGVRLIYSSVAGSRRCVVSGLRAWSQYCDSVWPSLPHSLVAHTPLFGFASLFDNPGAFGAYISQALSPPASPRLRATSSTSSSRATRTLTVLSASSSSPRLAGFLAYVRRGELDSWAALEAAVAESDEDKFENSPATLFGSCPRRPCSSCGAAHSHFSQSHLVIASPRQWLCSQVTHSSST